MYPSILIKPNQNHSRKFPEARQFPRNVTRMDPTHYCRIWEVGLTLKCCHQRFRLKISGEVNVFFVITKLFFWLRFEILDSVMEQEKCTFCVCVFSFFLASVWKLTGQLEVNQTTETIDFQTTSTGVVYWWALGLVGCFLIFHWIRSLVTATSPIS